MSAADEEQPSMTDLTTKMLVAVSGLAASGKTTLATTLGAQGWQIASFGDAVRRHRLEGESVATAGKRINDAPGQQWLCQEVLETLGAGKPAVVEGLRFREDVEFFASRFEGRFLHVHLRADAEHRRMAFIKRDAAGDAEWAERNDPLFGRDESWVALHAHLTVRTDDPGVAWVPAITAFIEAAARAQQANPATR